MKGELNRARKLFNNPKKFIHCDKCSFVRDPHNNQNSENICPICGGILKEEIMIQPEVFGPEKARELNEDDREQEITYATAAQYPQPVDPEDFKFNKGGAHIVFTHAIDQKLVTVNRGKNEGESSGFSVCCECGAASVYDSYSPARGHMKDRINIYLLRKRRAYARANINAFFSDMISVQICSYYE